MRLPKGAKEPMAKAMKSVIDKSSDLASMVYGSEETDDPLDAMPPADLVAICNEIGELFGMFLSAYPGLQLQQTNPEPVGAPNDSQDMITMSKTESAPASSAELLPRIDILEKILGEVDEMIAAMEPAPAPAAAPAPAPAPSAFSPAEVEAIVARAVAGAAEKFSLDMKAAEERHASQLSQVSKQLTDLQRTPRVASSQLPVTPPVASKRPAGVDVTGDMNRYFASRGSNTSSR